MYKHRINGDVLFLVGKNTNMPGMVVTRLDEIEGNDSTFEILGR